MSASTEKSHTSVNAPTAAERRLQKRLQTEADPRWQQVMSRDKAADGQFYYSVATTGVYCRPSCAARTARAENVDFFLTTRQAEQAGFRPCKRCKPDQPSLDMQQMEKVAQACRLIKEAEQEPSLDTLAATVGLSVFYLHRLFKRLTGLTPREFAAGVRAERMRTALQDEARVTDAIYQAGYQSSSRFYERADQLLGMTPSRYRAGGKDTLIRFALAQCSLGALLVAGSDKGLCAIWLGDDAERLLLQLQEAFPAAELIGADAEFEQWVAQVVGMVEQPAVGISLPLDIRGTAFQQRVWQALLQIPVGQTLSYSEVAQRIGSPKAVRAVASACAANMLAVAIPCHRVVRNDGSLSGYRWGLERKARLLQQEQQGSDVP